MTELIVGTTIFSAEKGIITEKGTISSWPEGKKFFCRIIRPDGETWVGSGSRYRESPGMVVFIPRLLEAGEGIEIKEVKNNYAMGIIITPQQKKIKRCKDCGGEICDEGLFKSVGDNFQIKIKMHPCQKCGRAYSKGGKSISGKMGAKIFLRNGEIFSGDLVPGQK